MEPDQHAHDDLIFIDPSYPECVLAAGDETDIPALREWCARIDPRSYGRVFIEVDDAEQVESLVAPRGVGITWLIRRGEHPVRGDALTRAVDAWLDEWLRGDPLSGRNVLFRPGLADDPRVQSRWRSIELELAETWAAAIDYRAQLT